MVITKLKVLNRLFLTRENSLKVFAFIILLSFFGCSNDYNGRVVSTEKWNKFKMDTTSNYPMSILLPKDYISYENTTDLLLAGKLTPKKYATTVVVNKSHYQGKIDKSSLKLLTKALFPDFKFHGFIYKYNSSNNYHIATCTTNLDEPLKGFYACFSHPQTDLLAHVFVVTSDDDSETGFSQSKDTMLTIVNSFHFD